MGRARPSSSRRTVRVPPTGRPGSTPLGSTAARPTPSDAPHGPPPATLVLLDEHDAAHKPPGPPRIHSRDLLRQRAMLEGSRLILLSATPSVESWWLADSQQAIRAEPEKMPWPQVVTADARGILRNHPLTLPLTRAIEETTRRGRRVILIVTRRVAALVCPECGALLRCRECRVPLAFSRGAKALNCRLCATTAPLPERCPGCGGHRLSPSGWDPERVEAAVSRRFPKLTVSRTDPRAQVVVGTPAALRRLPPGRLGCVGIVALDGLLSVPDFRGGERAFELVWAAAEAVAPSGRLIIQTLHPDHYAVQAAKEQDAPSWVIRPSAGSAWSPSAAGATARRAPASVTALRRCGASAASRSIPRRHSAPPGPGAPAGNSSSRDPASCRG